MSKLKPKSWTVTVVAGVPINISPLPGVVLSVAYSINNTTTGNMKVGGEDGQFYTVPAGTAFDWSGLDTANSDTQSLTSSSDIYVLCDTDGTLEVIAGVGA